MAIVQISQITNRLGLQTDLPQLAGAELGWSTDTRQLYIGNGTLEEGAPVIGNTEILTEFSDILQLAASYTYKGLAGGYTVQTGPTVGDPVVLSLQTWMDQFCTVKDFGAMGDGLTDDTDAINRALNQIYCQQTNPSARRGIFFPAGVYIVSDTINIPTYAMLFGEGSDCSIIQLVPSTTFIGSIAGTTLTVTNQLTGAVAVGQTITGDGVTPGTTVVSGSGTTWLVSIAQAVAATTLSGSSSSVEYVAQTADSLQQTGVNIGNNGAVPPTDITLVNMSFQTTDITKSAMLVASATFCNLHNVAFVAPGTTSNLTSNTLATTGVNITSSTSIVTTNIVISSCRFNGFVYGVSTNDQTKGITVGDSIFNTLYQGVSLGYGSVVDGGPTGFRIVNNTFDNIYNEGIFMGDVSLNFSGSNIFYDVADQFNGLSNPTGPVIQFQQNNNVSVGDMFARTDAFAVGYPRIQINDTVSIAFTNGVQLQMGTKTTESGLFVNLSDATTNGTVLTFDALIAGAFKVDYSVIRGGINRTGTLLVATAGTGTPAIVDNSVESGASGITFTVLQSGQTLTVQYTTTNTGTSAQMRYSISYFN